MSTLVKIAALSSIAEGDSRVFVQNMLHLVSQIKCRRSNVVKEREAIILLKYDIYIYNDIYDIYIYKYDRFASGGTTSFNTPKIMDAHLNKRNPTKIKI